MPRDIPGLVAELTLDEKAALLAGARRSLDSSETALCPACDKAALLSVEVEWPSSLSGNVGFDQPRTEVRSEPRLHVLRRVVAIRMREDDSEVARSRKRRSASGRRASTNASLDLQGRPCWVGWIV